MPNDGVTDKVAARLTIDISPAEQQLKQLQESYRRFNDQLKVSWNMDEALKQSASKMNEYAVAIERDVSEVKKQLESNTGQTFMETAQGQLVSLRDAIRNTQLSFKEGQIAAQDYIRTLEGLRTSYSGDFSGSNGMKSDLLLRSSILQAQKEISSLHDFELESERRLSQQKKTILDENQRFEAESINNQMRQIKEFYNMKTMSAEEALSKVRALMTEETEFFEQNEAKKIEAMKMESKFRTDMQAQQARMSQVTTSSTDPFLNVHMPNVPQMATHMAAGMAMFASFDALNKIPQTLEDISAGMTKLKQVLELSDQIKGVQQLNDSLGQLQQVAEKQAVLYGQNVSTVLDVMVQAGRRFKDIPSIIVATDNALQAMVADNVDAMTAIKGEEAMMAQFGLSLGETRDAWAKLTVASHMFLTDATGIIDAVERSGSAFHGMKMNTDTAIASIVSLAQESGRTGSVVGNTFKSLITSFETDKGVKALQQLGIEARLSNGQLQDGLTILGKLQEKWPQLSEASRQAFANILSGGKYQINQLLTFLNDTSGTYVKALNAMKKANQETQQELVKSALESLPNQMKMTSAEMQVMANSFSNVATPAMMTFFANIREGSKYIGDHVTTIEKLMGTGMSLAEAYVAWRVGLKLYTAAVESATLQNTALQLSLLKLEIQSNGAKTGLSLLTGTMGSVAATAATTAAKIGALVAVVALFNDLAARSMDPLGAKENDLKGQLSILEQQKEASSPNASFGDVLKLSVQPLKDMFPSWNPTDWHIIQGFKEMNSAVDGGNNGIDNEIDNVRHRLRDVQAERKQQKQEEYDKYQKEVNDALAKANAVHLPPPPIGNGGENIIPQSGKGKKEKQYQDVTGPYADLINASAHQNGIDPNLVRAVAMQESSLGQDPSAGVDIMQASEGAGHKMKSAGESFNAGAAELARDLKLANGNVKEALAAYNMGPGILDYFNSHGGYSLENMQTFSNLQKKKHGYKVYGDPNYVQHVERYMKGETSDSESSKDVSQPYKDAISQMEYDLSPYLNLNKSLDSVLQSLSDRQGMYNEILKHGSSDTKIATEETKLYQQQLDGLNTKQESLHDTNEVIRSDMAKIQEKMKSLNPGNSPLSSLSEGTQQALQSLSQEYNKLSQQADENGRKWWDAQKQITEATLGWLDALYQVQDNGLKPLSDLVHQNENDVKLLQGEMGILSSELKNNGNDTKALTQYTDDYKRELSMLSEQSMILHLSNEQLRADNEDLQKKLDAVNQMYRQGKLTLDAYDASVQSLHEQINKNNDLMTQNTGKIQSNILSVKEEMDKINQMNFDRANASIKTMVDNLKQLEKDTLRPIDDQIRSIDQQLSNMEWNNQVTDDNSKMQDLKKQADQWKNSTSVEGRKKFEDYTKQITDLQTKMDRDNAKHELETKKQSLEDQKTKIQQHFSDLYAIYSGFSNDVQSIDHVLQQTLQSSSAETNSKIKGYLTDTISTLTSLQNQMTLAAQQAQQIQLQQQLQLPYVPPVQQTVQQQQADLQSRIDSLGQQYMDYAKSHPEIPNYDTDPVLTRLHQEADQLRGQLSSVSSSSSSGSHSSSSGSHSSNSGSGTPGSANYIPSVKDSYNGLDNSHIGSDGLTDYTRAAKDAAKKAAGLSVGGYIPKGKEGLVYLHQNEVVTNSDQTDKLNQMLNPNSDYMSRLVTNPIANVMQTIKFSAPQMVLPKFMMPTVQSTNDVTINMDGAFKGATFQNKDDIDYALNKFEIKMKRTLDNRLRAAGIRG